MTVLPSSQACNECALIASKGSSQWGFRAARAASPARVPFRLASIPPHCEGKGMGLLRQGRRLISIPLAYSLRCAGQAWPGQPRLPANKAPFIPRAGFLPATRGRRWAGPGAPSCRPGRAARPGAHRARFRRPALARDDLGFCLSRHHGEDPPKPAFMSGTGTCGHGVFSA